LKKFQIVAAEQAATIFYFSLALAFSNINTFEELTLSVDLIPKNQVA
jgi:hypothetical protein